MGTLLCDQPSFQNLLPSMRHASEFDDAAELTWVYNVARLSQFGQEPSTINCGVLLRHAASGCFSQIPPGDLQLLLWGDIFPG